MPRRFFPNIAAFCKAYFFTFESNIYVYPTYLMSSNKAKITAPEKNWNECKTQVFWGEIAPCNHVLQIYESDAVILASLEGFVLGGFERNESVVIIAAEERLRSLNARLLELGHDLDALQEHSYYIPLNAHECLAQFMVNGWPDEKKFTSFVTSVVKQAKGRNDRKVRAYGEMVAILWAQGNNGATVNLEQLWNKFCASESFCLFCAYPKSGFTQNVNESIDHICSHHTEIISGDNLSATHLFYKKT
jgi:hypothetical protein